MTIIEIYNKYKTEVFIYVSSKVKNTFDAEEITNNVFLKINKYPYDSKNSMGATINTWIRTITNQQIIDFFRTSRHNQNLDTINVNGWVSEDEKETFSFVAPVSTNADKDVLTGETQTQIVNAFHSLKPKYRRIASLYFISGYKYSEIATMLNVPEGTVKGMLNRARAKLQESLKVAQMA